MSLSVDEPKNLIQTGDAGIVIKADGSVRIFNTFALENAGSITAEQGATGRKLLAIANALGNPEVMDILFDYFAAPTGPIIKLDS